MDNVHVVHVYGHPISSRYTFRTWVKIHERRVSIAYLQVEM